MQEAIIYGGAFNPPTKAHQAILQACLDRAVTTGSEVWVMPSGERRDKSIGASNETRFKLVAALCESVVSHGVTLNTETLELDSDDLTETYYTHQALQAKYPDYTYKWVFGSDSVATMKSWKNGLWLYKNMGMLVIPRPGYLLDELPENAEILPVNVPKMSSTEVRNKIQGGDPVDHLVPEAVHRMLEYIE